jgi:hypothetical protein
MIREKILIESHYLPCIAYFSVLNRAARICLDVHEHYRKQSYRSRCRILGANGPLDLIVPVVHGGGRQAMREVQICRRTDWERQHIQSIRSAYGKAPFFEHYSESLFDTLKKRFKFLTDLNLATLEWGLNAIGLKPDLCATEGYIKTTEPDVWDIREKIRGKKAAGKYYIYAVSLFSSFWH